MAGGSDPQQPRRGRPRRASARDAIIEAALALLAERGFQGTTIEAIALRGGVGRNTIYRRWSSKEELIADALQELTADLDLLEAGDFRSRLLEHIRDLVRLFADPLFGRILPGVLGELQRNPTFAQVYVERVVDPRRRAIVDLLLEARERGELRPDADVQHVADLLAGPPFLRLLPLGLPPVGERYAEELLDTIWDGIAP